MLMIESEILVVLVLFSNAFDFLLCGDIFARSENAKVMVKLVTQRLGYSLLLQLGAELNALAIILMQLDDE